MQFYILHFQIDRSNHRYFLKGTATFYSPEDKSFFGRTCETQEVQMEVMKKQLLYLKPASGELLEFQLFFYTARVNPKFALIVEFVIAEYDQQGSVILHQVGTVIAPTFLNSNEVSRPIQIYKASPRDILLYSTEELLTMRIPDLKSSGYELEYYFIQLKEPHELQVLAPIYPLVKEFSLFSSADVFPGIDGNKIPKNTLISPILFSPLEKRKLYILRLQLKFLNWDEQHVISRAENCYNALHPWANHKARITDRRLRVLLHNSWKSLGNELVFNLGQPIQDENNESVSILKAGADVYFPYFQVSRQIGVLFQVIFTVKTEGERDVYENTVHVCNFFYLPRVVTNKTTLEVDIKDEVLNLSQNLTKKQKSFFGEAPLLIEDSEEIVQVYLEGVLSTNQTAAAQLDIEEMKKEVQKKIEEEQKMLKFVNKDIEKHLRSEIDKNRELQQQYLNKKKEHSRVLEEVEKLKFKQDVRTGLTYFDRVKQEQEEGRAQIKELKEKFEGNLEKLINMVQPDEEQKKQVEEKFQETILRQKIEIPTQIESYPQPESRPMTRAETLIYIRNGHQQLINLKRKDKDQIKLMNELNDAQRISKFTLTFLGLHSRQILSICYSFVFKLSFYTFAPRTFRGKLGPCGSLDEPVLILNDKGKQNGILFELNCISERDLNDFFKFMLNGKLVVEVFDQVSNFKLAQGEVNILQSVRQGEEYCAQGYQVILNSSTTQEQCGNLDIMVENQGVFVPQSIIDEANQEFNQKSPSKRRKVQSKPYTMTIENNYSTIEQKENMDENERKKFRVSRIKSKIKLTSIDQYQEIEMQESMMQQTLSQLESYKQTHINETLQSKIMKDKTFYQKVEVMQGEPSFFSINIKNPFQGSERFKINIYDEEMVKYNEISIVRNIKEMQHWDSNGMFNYINQGKRNEHEIFISDQEVELGGEEQFNVLVKVDVLREACYDSELEENQYRYKKKVVKIEVLLSNGSALSITELEIHPRYQPCELMMIKDCLVEKNKQIHLEILQNFSQYMMNFDNTILRDELKTYSVRSNIGTVKENENKLTLSLKTSNEMNHQMMVFIFIYKQAEYIYDLIKVLKIPLTTAFIKHPIIRIGKENVFDLHVNSQKYDIRISPHTLQNQEKVNIMIDPEDKNYFAELITAQNDIRLQFQILNKKSQEIESFLIVEPQFKKPKIDKIIDLKNVPRYQTQCFRVLVENTFEHSTICQVLVDNPQQIKVRNTLVMQNYDDQFQIEFQLRQSDPNKGYLEHLMVLSPLYLGHSESIVLLIKITFS